MWIVIVLLICFIIYLIITIPIYLDGIPDGNPICIKFNDFKKYYEINKNRWNLHDNYVSIYTSSRKMFGKNCYFGYLDTFKYKKFRKNIQNKKEKESLKQDYIEILEAIQEDINALRKQSNQEIKEASNKAIEIAERIKEKQL